MYTLVIDLAVRSDRESKECAMMPAPSPHAFHKTDLHSSEDAAGYLISHVGPAQPVAHLQTAEARAIPEHNQVKLVMLAREGPVIELADRSDPS
jgi:hypothetical protein